MRVVKADFVELVETKSVLEEIAKHEQVEGISERMDQAFMGYCISHRRYNILYALRGAIDQGMKYFDQQLKFKEEASVCDSYHRIR